MLLLRSAVEANQPDRQVYRMVRETIATAFGTGLSKCFGAVKVILTARLFGASDAMDAFLVAFLLPSFFSEIVAGPLETALVPVLLTSEHEHGKRAAGQVYGQVLFVSTLFLLLVGVILAAFTSPLLRAVAPRFSADQLEYARRLSWTMLPILPLSGVQTAARSALIAHRRFTIATLVPAITPIIITLILLIDGKRWGVDSLAFGTVVGVAVQGAASVAAASFFGTSPVMPKHMISGALAFAGRRVAPLLALSIVLGASPVIDQIVAAHLPAGSISSLSYGTRLAILLSAVGPLAAATVVLPHISSLMLSGDRARMFQTLRRYSSLIVLGCSLAIVPLIVLSDWIVRLILQGTVVSVPALHTIIDIQRLSLIQVPFSVAAAIGVRVLSVLQANSGLYGVAALDAGLTLCFDWVFAQNLGTAGIVIAGLVVRVVCVLYLFCKIVAAFGRPQTTAIHSA